MNFVRSGKGPKKKLYVHVLRVAAESFGETLLLVLSLLTNPQLATKWLLIVMHKRLACRLDFDAVGMTR